MTTSEELAQDQAKLDEAFIHVTMATKPTPRDFTFADLKIGDAFYAGNTQDDIGPYIKKKAKAYAHAFFPNKKGSVTAPKQTLVTPIFKYAARVHVIRPDKRMLLKGWTNSDFTTDDFITLESIQKLISTTLYRYHLDGTWFGADRFRPISDAEDAFIRKLPQHFTGKWA